MHFTNFDTNTNGSRINFEINDVDVSVVNSIRRTVFTDIPSVGFYFDLNNHFVENDLTIEQNDSPLHNEFLAHRFSLIPIHLDKDEIDNWSQSEYQFILEKSNTSNEIVNVTTGDFQILNTKTGKIMPASFIKRLFPANEITEDYILLTKLKPNLEDNDKGNHIKISGYARKGVGRDCICWGVVSECTFFNTIDKAFAKSVIDEQIKDKTKEEQKSMIQDFNSLEQYRYYDKNKFGDPNSFQFSLESETGLSAKYILYKSIVILTNMFQKLLVELREKNDSEVITIVPADVPNMYVITFKNFTHTVGNLIQSHMLNNHIRGKPDNDTYDLDYVGYSVPHPLEELFILKVKFNKVVSVKQLYSFMKENLERIETELLQLTEEWVSFSQVDV
jgi:DNA-directed RNA polymerase subunit L